MFLIVLIDAGGENLNDRGELDEIEAETGQIHRQDPPLEGGFHPAEVAHHLQGLKEHHYSGGGDENLDLVPYPLPPS